MCLRLRRLKLILTLLPAVLLRLCLKWEFLQFKVIKALRFLRLLAFPRKLWINILLELSQESAVFLKNILRKKQGFVMRGLLIFLQKKAPLNQAAIINGEEEGSIISLILSLSINFKKLVKREIINCLKSIPPL